MVSVDKIDEDRLWITEVWDSKEDHDNLLKLANVLELIDKAMSLIDGIPQKGLEMNVFWGVRIDF